MLIPNLHASHIEIYLHTHKLYERAIKGDGGRYLSRRGILSGEHIGGLESLAAGEAGLGKPWGGQL